MIGHGYPEKSTTALLMACLIVVFANDLQAQGPAAMNVPLVNKDGGVGLTAAPGFGVKVSARLSEDMAATQLTFNSPFAERRIAALAGVPDGEIEGARALVFDCRLAMRQGDVPPLVALFFENDGGAWYRISSTSPPRGRFGEIRLPLSRPLTRARFATDLDETIRWEQVERVWLGLLIDGPAEGVTEVRQVRFTSEPFRPASAVTLSATWDIAQDSAVHSKLEPAMQGAEGNPTIEYHFELPGGRHMYAMVRTPVEVDELDAYSALQFTYQADLPEGIDELLVMLIERDGTQYRAVPAPAESGQWKTVTIPFEKFERGSWSKDENEQLDLEDVNHVSIGMHGTTPAAGSGTIKVRDVQIVP